MIRISFTIFTSLLFNFAFAQFKLRGTFAGLEEIRELNQRKDTEHPNHKWYHLSVLTFKGDSVFLKQSPVSVYKTDTIFSASDGGFYYYAGKLRSSQGKIVADLDLTSCDYCPAQFIRFIPPKIMIDEDSTAPAPNDTAATTESPVFEDISYKYKILFLEKTANADEIMVNKNIYRRQKIK